METACQKKLLTRSHINRYILPALLILLLMSSAACGNKSGDKSANNGDNASAKSAIHYQHVFPALSFDNPTTLLLQADDNSRWYIAEKGGKIFFFDNNPDVKNKTLYLDISARVDESFEGGLLGMAFDPKFTSNGFVYLSYTTSDFPENDNSDLITSRLSRFSVNKDNTQIIPDSEIVLLSLDQPWNNHNGGNILFGPDGYLYLGFGDGGAWGDQKNYAQNTRTWFGSILRLDVSPENVNKDAERKYAIPPDNPFVASKDCNDGKGCPEIYAWGFRNPWRFSFDAATGALWVGDVGQGEWEEIDRVEKGRNYGWRCYEGNEKYNFKECNSDTQYTAPVLAYSHRPSDSARDGMAASVTGGYIYRGKIMKDYTGSYFYADFIHGLIFVAADAYGESPEGKLLLDTDFFIVSFSQDNSGEIYFLSYQENAGIYQLQTR